jgi:periplasmic protein CpxP/Spy
MLTRTLLAAACAALLAATAFAEETHHPEQQGKPAASKPAGNMPEMMTRMQEQMKQIHATSDPKERQRLMNEHMKTMHESMPMMQGMKEGAGMGSGQRMDAMGQRMDRMEQMMQQMLEHQKAREAAPNSQ